MSMSENRDVACFLVVKHSWKGKYKRIFSVGTHGITTYNPATTEVTNQWPYGDFNSIRPSNRPGSVPGEFTIQMKNKKKADSMRFSCEYTADVLTHALRFRQRFADASPPRQRFNAYKQHWSDNRVSVVLDVAEASIDQLDQRGTLLAHYDYKDIQEVHMVSDCPGGFCIVYGEQRRLHLFACQGAEELLQAARVAAYENVGLGCKVSKEPFSLRQFTLGRLGRCGSDQQITSFVEFTVYKHSARHANAVRRLLCLSETCVLERDPSTYAVITIRPLIHVHCLIRCADDPQKFEVEYDVEQTRVYTSSERDTILASLLDGVRAAGNNDVHVQTQGRSRRYRMIPYRVWLDEEGESHLLRHLISPPPGAKRIDMLRRFNANTPYSGLRFSVTQEGLFTENKEKLIVNCLSSILGGSLDGVADVEVEAALHVLHRLFASKAGFHAFTAVAGLREKLGNQVIATMRRGSECVDHAAVDVLCTLLQPMHPNYELRQEQYNKTSLLSTKVFLEHLLDTMAKHVERRTGALVISSLLDFLTYALCAPYSETTAGDHFDALLQLVADRGRVFYKLFQFPSMTIVKGAGLVMQAIVEESDADTSARMQELALVEGAVLQHLHLALFTDSKDIRMLTNRQLSRKLLALWVTGNEKAKELLSRSLPCGLLNFLESEDDVPVNEEEFLDIRNNLNMAQAESEQRSGAVAQQLMDVQRSVERQLDSLLQHWRLRQKLTVLKREDKAQQRPVVLRKRRARVKPQANWKLFFYQFSKDHAKADLIWNHKTREELRESLEAELRALATDKELIMSEQISWNHPEFHVEYPSLNDEVRIGHYFLRMLLEEDKHSEEELTEIHRPYEFFNEVYHRFLLSAKSGMRCLCLQSMAVTYGRHHARIQAFPDTRYIVAMLEKCTDATERDHLLVLLSKLILNKENVRELLKVNGVGVLVDLLTLAHLHVSRAYVPTQVSRLFPWQQANVSTLQTNVIEASADMSREGAAEWYYSAGDSTRQGPVSFQELRTMYAEGTVDKTTRCWAQGLDGWRPLGAVAQLRWTLAFDGAPTLNETELAVLVLNMLIKMCQYFPSRDESDAVVRPTPQIKRVLSQPGFLPHVVQLLLTFDPVIVEKTSTLLYLIMQDNPYVSRLYLTGVFFFILMYTGSNVLPVARFLAYTHLRQAFRSELGKSHASVLSSVLPEAAIYYLENYGADKYAEVFLGNFDHPEVIWNSEMRREMMEKVAAHVADFSARLPSNVKAVYQFCPIAAIVYPQLEDELFCDIYYLRHLCDTARFPDWPIKDPVSFLKSCLAAWQDEIDKKPPSMSAEDAATILELTIDSDLSEATIRKAYFRLAQKFHPDKNPEGRETFEQINAAYELLCSRSLRKTLAGPDPDRIVLCLRAQSIVYSRYTDELAPYKYAGYPQLIRTIRLETHDDALFSKGAPLLAAATELCFYTLACSALNAEQLRRENGLEALEEAFNRCVSVLGKGSKPDDLAVQVCLHICRCFATASQFEACREKLSQMPQVFRDVCHVLYFRHLVKLCSYAADCVRALAVCTMLQTQFFQAGVLWHLVPNLFGYDFTLDEGGVAKDEGSNEQELRNRLARESCNACAALAGYADDCPPNDGVQNSLIAMLSPYVVGLMRDGADTVLKTLNTNTQNPYLIWDNGTRAELLEYIDEQRASTEQNEKFGAEFEHSAHKRELIIGDIFVRIYNVQPSFMLAAPKKFCADLLDFLGAQVQYMHSVVALRSLPNGVEANGAHSCEERLGDVERALEALANVVQANAGLEMLCIGHFKLLFSYLRIESRATLQTRALEVIRLAAANQECVGDIAASNGLVDLLLLLPCLPQCAGAVIASLLTLSSSGKIVKDAMNLGGLLYILDLFCNHDDAEVRAGAAALLGKLQSDKLTGPRWTRQLELFLPPIFSEATRDSPTACVQRFDRNDENPELIWSEETRRHVQTLVADQSRRLYETQKKDPDCLWKPADSMQRAYEGVVAGEFVVGGVFLRLFIAQPGYVLRNPRHFLTELLERLLAETRASEPDGERLETLAAALEALLSHQSALADQIPSQGYLPQLCNAMNTSDGAVARAALVAFHQLAASPVCVEGLAGLEFLGSVQTAMRARPDLLHVAAKALRALFGRDDNRLVAHALQTDLVDYLLELLGSALTEVENAPAVKAEIVETLKAISRNLEHGDEVGAILSKSRTWEEFKDQKHDLFLTSAPQMQAIAGGSARVAGYLTGVMNNQQVPVAPPL